MSNMRFVLLENASDKVDRVKGVSKPPLCWEFTLKIFFFLLLYISFFTDCLITIPSFPGAEGFGSKTRGAFGGSSTPVILKVTNTKDKGKGSLREALMDDRPRVVIFKTGGNIKLKKDIYVKNPYLTIAGQTAPGSGICISNGALRISTHDVIVRGLRWRNGKERNITRNQDCISIENYDTPPYNVIVDHCSLSWGSDEIAVTWFPSHNVTWQWNIISEGLMAYEEHGFGLLVGDDSKNISIHHNLFAHLKMRLPECNSNTSGEIINNLMYNFSDKAIDFTSSPTRANFGPMYWNVLKNYFKRNSEKHNGGCIVIFNYPGWNNGQYYIHDDSKFYIKGNFNHDNPDISDDWDLVYFFGESSETEKFKSDTPVTKLSGIKEHPAEEVHNIVLDKVGARVPALDPVDKRIIDDVINYTGRIIDSVDDDDYPIYSAGIYPEDDDDDGIPNYFELLYSESKIGLNPYESAPGDYKWIEEYINSLFPKSIKIEANPENISSDGTSGTIIRAEIKDIYDLHAFIKAPVTFELKGPGIFSNNEQIFNTTAINGVANATLFSTTKPGTIIVSVSSPNSKPNSVKITSTLH